LNNLRPGTIVIVRSLFQLIDLIDLLLLLLRIVVEQRLVVALGLISSLASPAAAITRRISLPLSLPLAGCRCQLSSATAPAPRCHGRQRQRRLEKARRAAFSTGSGIGGKETRRCSFGGLLAWISSSILNPSIISPGYSAAGCACVIAMLLLVAAACVA
jgi:hypothetical protein